MEPFHPNDPVWKLLGQARKVEPRGNFTQDVVRAARQTQQDRGLWARLAGYFQDHPTMLPRLSIGAAAVALALLLMVRPGPDEKVVTQAPVEDAAPVSEVVEKATPAAQSYDQPLLTDVEVQLENLNQMDALLAIEDTSTLTDREIAFLLY